MNATPKARLVAARYGRAAGNRLVAAAAEGIDGARRA